MGRSTKTRKLGRSGSKLKSRIKLKRRKVAKEEEKIGKEEEIDEEERFIAPLTSLNCDICERRIDLQKTGLPYLFQLG